MNYIFLSLSLLVVGYILFKKRRFDYFAIAGFSAVFYYYPGFLGKLRPSSSSSEVVEILPGVYVCVVVYMLMLFLFILFNDKYKIIYAGRPIFKKRDKVLVSDTLSNLAVVCLELVGMLMLVYTIGRYGQLSSGFNKALLLMNSNRITEYLKYIALFTFVYHYTAKGKYVKIGRILSSILIGYTFLLGHRSYIVLGIICIFLHYVAGEKKVRIFDIVKKHKLLFLFMICAIFFFLFVKGVLAALITGQFDIVIERLTNPEYYLNQLLGSEANSILMNMQLANQADLKYSAGSYLLGVVLLIPFFGGQVASFFNYKTYGQVLNEAFNTKLDEGYGMASTYLGEAYSISGVISLVIILVFTFAVLLCVIKWMENSKDYYLYIYLNIILSYMTFFIHRNSLPNLLITARAYAYILFFVLGIRWFLKAFLGNKSRR